MLELLNIRGFEDWLLVVCFCILVFVVAYYVIGWFRLAYAKLYGGKPNSGGYVDTTDVTPVETIESLADTVAELKLSLFMKEQALLDAQDGLAELTFLKAHMASVDKLLVAANSYITALEALREVPCLPPETERFDFFGVVKSSLGDLGVPKNLYEAGVYNGLVSVLRMSDSGAGMIDPKAYPQPAKPFARAKDGRFCKAPITS